ncbi:LysE family translocator, partial [Streptococcus pyogenes]|uniref:LysE family translocator n=1 Tax=Streptococcus pyogenes TaxID=1314 RepID=UPI003DA1C473
VSTAMVESLLPLITYCSVMFSTPGPNNVMLATSGANFGFRRTVPHLLGINFSAFALTLVACLGLGTVFTKYPALHSWMKVVGATYLVYLAWRLAWARVTRVVGASKPLTFLEGLAFQLVNPKGWMRVVTVATVFMPPSMNVVHAALLVSGVGFVLGVQFNSVWALFGAGIGRILGSPLHLRVFNVAMGLSLLGLAAALLLQLGQSGR